MLLYSSGSLIQIHLANATHGSRSKTESPISSYAATGEKYPLFIDGINVDSEKLTIMYLLPGVPVTSLIL